MLPNEVDDSIHHIVYQCNRADNDYFGSILFSAGEILRKYSDDAVYPVSPRARSSVGIEP